MVGHAQQAASSEVERSGPLQIGFGRNLPSVYQGDLVPRLAWETQSDGTAISALSVSSPDARALRITLRATLPTGAEVRFFSPADPEQRFPPVQPAEVPADPVAAAEALVEEEAVPLWSPVVEGDTVGVEISLPPATTVSEVSLFIDRVSHLSTSVRQAAPLKLSDVGDAASCNIDVACRSTTPPNLARATAKMIYTRPDGASFLCSGTLMVDSDDSSHIPYFLTANHCIDTQTVARSLNTYWGFERASCGGPAPTSVNQLTGGADLLATDAETDATLLRLRETPVGPTWYAGWSAAPLLNPFLDPTEVVGIHHPRGDLKKWSRGRPIRNSTHILQGTGQSVSSILVEWSEGTIEGGSSGSGLFDTTGRLRGITSGRPVSGTACGFSRESFYGRFDLFWPQVSRWLAPVAGPSDHGDTRAEATRLQPDTEEAGDLDRAGDVDYFRIEVAEAGRLTVETTGPTDTVGYLQDAQGQPLAEDDNAGADDNFRIVRQVPAGTYYVGVVGAPRQRVDDHGNTAEEATRVGLDSTTAGVIEQGSDVDYFRITVTQAGTLTIETTGTAGRCGYLLDAVGVGLAGECTNQNFQIVEHVTPGTYYVEVEGFDEDDIGSYALRVRFTATPPSGTSLHSILGTWRFTFRILLTFTDTYRLSRVDNSTGTPLIWGTDEFGNPVTAGRIRDLVPSSTLPYEFALLDPGISICNFYLFNKTGSNSVSGIYYLIRDGDCDTSVGLADPYSMTGTRISLATQADQTARQPQAARTDQGRGELRRAEEARSMIGKSTSRTARSARRNDNLLPDVVKALSRQLADSL